MEWSVLQGEDGAVTTRGLVAVQLGNRLRLGGIEGRRLIEPGLGVEVDFEVGRYPWRMDVRGLGGLPF